MYRFSGLGRMAQASAFQADYAGSIPAARSSRIAQPAVAHITPAGVDVGILLLKGGLLKSRDRDKMAGIIRTTLEQADPLVPRQN